GRGRGQPIGENISQPDVSQDKRSATRGLNVLPENLNGHGRAGITDDSSRPHLSSEDTGRRSGQALDAWSSSFEATLGGARTDVDELQGESISRRFMTGADSRHGQQEGLSGPEQSLDESVPQPPDFKRDLPDPGETEQSLGHEQNDLAGEFRPVQQSGLTEPFEVEPTEDQPASVFGISEVAQESDDSTGGTGVNELSADAGGDRHLPMAGQENACCRNCRDFLPSKGSRSGWCNNPYAFAKRTEVGGDRVACQSTFGNWWSPSDDWWMERADIAHHSAPTPLVDTMIRQIRDREIDERGSTNATDRS
ncbi:MAG: hypothetical protein WD401_00040, partial [Thermomicrobiaceae bacterium]